MVVLNKVEYEYLQKLLQDLIHKGHDLQHELILNASIANIDFNLIQSLYSQLFVRFIKKKTSRFEESFIKSIIERVDVKNEKIRDIALTEGYSPYKAAKLFLSSTKNIDLSTFIENPCLITNELLR